MTAVEWLDAMSPWPRDGFGLDRMRELLAELGDPQDAYPAIHVVGTNGKSTATITIEQLLLSDGLCVGSTISPHVASWSERIRLDLNDAERAIFEAVVRPVDGRDGDIAAERERLLGEIARAEGMLANEKFVANAKPEVVEAEREKLARYRRELDALSG